MINNEEFIMLPEVPGNSSSVTKETVVSTKWDIWLDHEITEPRDFREELKTLLYAGENDEVYVHIDTCGGQIDTAIRFINSIRTCSANVTGILEAKAYSAGSIILLACPAIVVRPYSRMMCHSAWGGVFGTMDQQRRQLEAETKEINRLAKDIYSGFLSKDEIDQISTGKTEIWLTDKEILSRLDKLAKYNKVSKDD